MFAEDESGELSKPGRACDGFFAADYYLGRKAWSISSDFNIASERFHDGIGRLLGT